MGDFNPQKLPSRGLQTLWEWKNRVLLEEYYIFNAVIPPEVEGELGAALETKAVWATLAAKGRLFSRRGAGHRDPTIRMHQFRHPGLRQVPFRPEPGRTRRN